MYVDMSSFVPLTGATPSIKGRPSPHGSLTAAMLLALAFTSSAHAANDKLDLAKIKDHPLVTRFAGSKAIGQVAVDFDAIELPLAGLRSDKKGFEKARNAEGRITRIAYTGPDGKTSLEVYRNFRDALEKAGFEIDFECAKDTCGDGYAAASRMVETKPKLNGGMSTMIDTLQSTSSDVRILTARLARTEGPVDVSLLVSKDGNRPVGSMVTVVEGKAMQQGQVKVDAKAMNAGLDSAGHIALYGIQFKTDSAELAPSSDETLGQMAVLLKSQPNLKVYIVGHTDNAGSVTHNLTLSQQRADAVVKALSGKHGVAANRMVAKGLASFAPVASNESEPGRAKNRRVELVAQ